MEASRTTERGILRNLITDREGGAKLWGNECHFIPLEFAPKVPVVPKVLLVRSLPLLLEGTFQGGLGRGAKPFNH